MEDIANTKEIANLVTRKKFAKSILRMGLVETEAVKEDILKDATSLDVPGQTVLTYMILTQITRFSNVKDAKMCGMTEHM